MITNKVTRRAKRLARVLVPSKETGLGDIRPALEYIEQYWPKLVKQQPTDNGTLIGLPYPYVVPAVGMTKHFSFEEQHYWDTYFIALGLIGPQHQELVEGMLENLMYLLKRFGLIPNASRMYMTSRSQPPILTSYIFLVYERYQKPLEWLLERIELAKQEYYNVWMGDRHPNWHLVHKGLSRYYDINVLHDLAEAESGWDMTTRFERKCLDFLPVDLNALLYKYERDFAWAAELAGNKKEAEQWLKAAARRKSAMDKCMWGKLRGFYFDYNYQKEEQGSVWSLAAYYTMWSGMATKEQAARMVENLSKFEVKGGLATTMRSMVDFSMFGSLKTQWTRPNGWAPLHLITIEGLRKYGYHKDARRIALKWLKTNLDWYERHGEFLEKYNVVQPNKKPQEGVYPSQTGFGWTNAVFVRLCKEYLEDV